MDRNRQQLDALSERHWQWMGKGLRAAESHPWVMAFASLAIVSVSIALRPRPEPGNLSLGSKAPQFSEDGALLLPEDFPEWVFVGASTGLSYSESGREPRGPGLFHNVYLTPSAYRFYRETGEFPQGTLLALAMHPPAQKDELVRGGYFEGKLIALEIAVKDSTRFPQGWAYFNFTKDGRLLDRARPLKTQRCYQCHRQHGAQDNVFVQFYPVLRDREQSGESQ